MNTEILNALKQRYAAILRQAAAWAAIAYSIVTSIQGTSWGAKETVLTTIGGLLLAIEHYVGDPSTGSTTPPPTPPAPTLTLQQTLDAAAQKSTG